MPAISVGAVLTTLIGVFALYVFGRELLRPFERSLAALGPGFRPTAATVLGYAVYTVFADLAVKVCGPTVWGFALAPAAALAALVVVVRCWRDEPAVPTPVTLDATRGQHVLALLFAAIVVLQMLPVRWGENVYWGTPEIDWRSRLGVIHALARDGVPAANPFFDPSGESKLFFYYGFFLFPAGCVALSGADAVSALATLVFLLAYGVATTAAALGATAVGHARGGWIALLLCFVTGLDLLPVLALARRGQEPMSVEWWNPAQITAMTAFPVWTPHHTAAVLQVLLAHVLAWQMAAGRTSGRWLSAALLGLLLAGAGMSSTYVAMLGFASLGLQGGWKLLQPANRTEGVPLLAALVVGTSICVPFYALLARHDEHGGPALAAIVRPCPGEADLQPALVKATGVSPALALFLIRIVGLIPQYFIEFGVLFFVLMFWRRTGVGVRFSHDLWRSLGVMTATAFVIGSILVSVRTWNCDLNWRIMHPVQIALVGAAAAFWEDFRRKRRPPIDVVGLACFVAIGFAGTAYDLYRARFDYVVRQPAQVRWAGIAERGAAVVNARAPASARILFVPPDIAKSARNGFWGHYLRGHVVLADANFNAYPYGPKKADVERVVGEVERIFASRTPMRERWELVKTLRVDLILLDGSSEVADPAALGVGAHVVAEDPDGAWTVVALRPGVWTKAGPP